MYPHCLLSGCNCLGYDYLYSHLRTGLALLTFSEYVHLYILARLICNLTSSYLNIQMTKVKVVIFNNFQNLIFSTFFPCEFVFLRKNLTLPSSLPQLNQRGWRTLAEDTGGLPFETCCTQDNWVLCHAHLSYDNIDKQRIYIYKKTNLRTAQTTTALYQHIGLWEGEIR